MLHDPAARGSIEARLRALRLDSPRQWGSMTPDQMLWHLNKFLSFALGEGSAPPPKPSLLSPVFRFMVLHMPWPKSTRTHPDAVPKERYDFDAERARCLALIERFVSRPLDGPWPVDTAFGAVTGRYTSRLQAKHLDHHFRQFGG